VHRHSAYELTFSAHVEVRVGLLNELEEFFVESGVFGMGDVFIPELAYFVGKGGDMNTELLLFFSLSLKSADTKSMTLWLVFLQDTNVTASCILFGRSYMSGTMSYLLTLRLTLWGHMFDENMWVASASFEFPLKVSCGLLVHIIRRSKPLPMVFTCRI
jgi:hypothetical protein